MPRHVPVPPTMTPHADRRSREFLYEDEVREMFAAVERQPVVGCRNAALLWIMYIHALRAGEARRLRWGQVETDRKLIHVERLKNGIDSTQPLSDFELGLLRRIRPNTADPDRPVFVTGQGTALEPSTLYKIVSRAGRLAEIGFPVHPHMLRHACGYHLINVAKRDIRRIRDYMGHRDINHTLRYTHLDDAKFDGFWDDWRSHPFDL